MSWLRRKKYFNHCPQLTLTWAGMQSWYQTALAQRLARQERALLEKALADLFGYHLLQIGQLLEDDWLSTSRISHRIIMDFPGGVLAQTNIAGIPENLPFQSDSIDVVILPHVLEYSGFPHEVLREVERVLIPEGHVVLLSFNPWSLLGLRRIFSLNKKRAPWCGRFLGTTRLKDWLALLGFEVLQVEGYFFSPPLRSEKILAHLGFWEGLGHKLWPVLGGANLIVARKRVTTLTPIRQPWIRQRQRIVSAGLAEPFQQHGTHNTQDSP